MKTCSVVLVAAVIVANGAYGSSLRITANPCARSYAGMITDSLNARAILFSGGDYRLPWGHLCNDVWSLDFDSEAWGLVTPLGSSPPSRAMAAVAYCAAAQELLVFGGYTGPGNPYYNDVWSLDLTLGSEEWEEISPSGTPPSARGSATAIVDPVNNRLIIFAGEINDVGRNDTWSLDLATMTWSKLTPSGTPPSARWEHSAIYDPGEHRMIVFGGRSSVWYNDVWALDLTAGSEAWTELNPSGPEPDVRGRHFCAYDYVHNEMIIGFGYYWYDYWYTYYSDVWGLDLGSLTWRQILSGGVVEGRRGSCAAFNQVNEEIVVFGGDQSYDYYFGDTYSLKVDPLVVYENETNTIGHSSNIRVSSNPCEFPCQIHAFVPCACNVTLRIYDSSGRFVKTLIHNERSSGDYTVNWDGNDHTGKKVAAGTYFITLETGDISAVEKVVIVE